MINIKNRIDGMSIDILGFPHTVVLEKYLSEYFDRLGQVRHYRHEIAIDADLLIEDVVSTILHEFIEVVNTRQELGLPHNVVTVLENSLFQFIKSNPKFMALILMGLYGDNTKKSTTKRET